MFTRHVCTIRQNAYEKEKQACVRTMAYGRLRGTSPPTRRLLHLSSIRAINDLFHGLTSEQFEKEHFFLQYISFFFDLLIFGRNVE